MDQQSVISRIRYLMSENGMKQNAFAARIGTDVSNFSKSLNGKLPISDALLNKIVVALGISKLWLAEGEGVPYSKPTAPDALTVKHLSEGGAIPIYDIDVTAGGLSREMMFADDRVVGHVSVPGINRNCKIVKVSGDSMRPVISNGDYIAVQEVTDSSIIYWGQIYVVLLDDYRMVKYLRRNADSTMVTLRSANPAYDDIDLPRSAIRSLFFVQHLLLIHPLM